MGLPWGIVGVATAYAIVSILFVLPNLLLPFRFIGMKVQDLGPPLAGPLFGSFIMTIGVMLLGHVLHLPSPVLTLAVLVLTGVLLYLLAGWVLNRRQLCEALHLILRNT